MEIILEDKFDVFFAQDGNGGQNLSPAQSNCTQDVGLQLQLFLQSVVMLKSRSLTIKYIGLLTAS